MKLTKEDIQKYGMEEELKEIFGQKKIKTEKGICPNPKCHGRSIKYFKTSFLGDDDLLRDARCMDCETNFQEWYDIKYNHTDIEEFEY